MSRKTKISFGLLALAALFAGLFLGLSPAQAQTSCGENDLRCRVAALEARLATLEGRQAQTEVQAQAQAAALERARPNFVDVARRCSTNCQPEAQDVCVSRGFASGAPEEWTRDRSGALTLTRANCHRQ